MAFDLTPRNTLEKSYIQCFKSVLVAYRAHQVEDKLLNKIISAVQKVIAVKNKEEILVFQTEIDYLLNTKFEEAFLYEPGTIPKFKKEDTEAKLVPVAIELIKSLEDCRVKNNFKYYLLGTIIGKLRETLSWDEVINQFEKDLCFKRTAQHYLRYSNLEIFQGRSYRSNKIGNVENKIQI